MQRSILARFARNRGGNGTGLSWRWGALLLAGAALAGWFLIARWDELQFEWGRFASSFLELRWQWVLAGTVLALLTYLGRAIRWAVMLEPLSPRPDLRGLVKATVIGFTAVVLFGRPGEIVRPYLIAIREKVPLSSQLAAWLLERIFDLLAVLIIFGFALGHLASTGLRLGPRFAWVLEIGGLLIGTLAVGCLVALLLFGRFSAPVRDRALSALRFLPAGLHQRIAGFLTSFLQGAAATRVRGSMLRLILYTGLEWVIITLGVWAILAAHPVTSTLGPVDVLVFLGFISLGGVIQIPGIGGGFQIVAIVVLTELYAVPVEIATGVTLLLWVTAFVVIVPFGLALGLHEGLNWRRLIEIRREADAAAHPRPAADTRSNL
jgi:hypothetical protein